MRGEFALIQAAFDHMPQISTTGVFNTIFNQSGNFTFVLPSAPGTLAMLSDIAVETSARVAADAAEVVARTAAIAAETARATGAEGVNAAGIVANGTAITAEAGARIAGDAGEVVARNAAIAAETAARISADSTETARALAAEAALTSTTTLRGYLSGLGLSNDGTTPLTVLDIAAGSATDSTNTSVITLAAAITKRTNATWAAGTGNGGLGVGVTFSSSWVHVYIATIAGVTDAFFDSAFPPTHAPAGTTAHRRIGSIFHNGAGIKLFAQTGDRFDWGTPVSEFSGSAGVTTAVTQSLSVAPPGVIITAIMIGNVADPTTPNSNLYLSSLAQNDIAAGAGLAITATSGATVSGNASFLAQIVTNTSAQIRRRAGTTTLAANIVTSGYIDTRGRG